jgi:hypothetical protein
VVVQHQGLSTGTLVLLLHKLLQPSDVTSLGRIVLPKVCIVRTHPFSLSTAEEKCAWFFPTTIHVTLETLAHVTHNIPILYV